MKRATVVQAEPFPVHFIEEINNSEAIPLYAEAWCYLLQHRLIDKSSFPNWKAACFFVPDAALATYTILEHDSQLWVGFTYIRHSERRRGILPALWRCLREKAKEKGCASIGFSCAPHNAVMNRIGKAFGTQTHVSYRIAI